MANVTKDYKPLVGAQKAAFLALTTPEPNSGCWLWTGGATKGYGVYKGLRAHRVSFSTFKGVISKELEINHKCRNKLCVNPDHLEIVTHQENMDYVGDVRLPNDIGRRRGKNKVVEVSISVPETLLNRLDLHFYDAGLGKPKYGARSRLIVTLLRTWLERQDYDGTEKRERDNGTPNDRRRGARR